MEILRDLPLVHKMEIVLKTEQCTLDHVCAVVEACPGHAVLQEGFFAPTLDRERCIKCGRCVNACSKGVFNKA